jgi:hypothetical protein
MKHKAPSIPFIPDSKTNRILHARKDRNQVKARQKKQISWQRARLAKVP